jgi:phospholipase C
MVISPFTKKNYVSHTPMDYTSYLRFIEARWGLATLTARDAAMPDMTEFFDFAAKPWATPPNPPVQSLNGACDFTKQ